MLLVQGQVHVQLSSARVLYICVMQAHLAAVRPDNQVLAASPHDQTLNAPQLRANLAARTRRVRC